MLRPGSSMQARGYARVRRKLCGCCGAELNPHQAVSSGICDSPRCREWKIEQVGAALLQRRRGERLERLFDRMAPSVEAAATAIGSVPEAVVRATAPYNANGLAPLPAPRRVAFEEHLRWIVEEAFAGTPVDDPAERPHIEAEENAPLSVACAACRGRCCVEGGTTAFLGEADVWRWRRRNPDATPESVVAGYMERVPGETIEGACVFLAGTGCVLPRTLRSDRCNSFQCREREAMQAALGPADDKLVLVAADEESEEPGAVVGWSTNTGAVTVPLVSRAVASGETGSGDHGETGR